MRSTRLLGLVVAVVVLAAPAAAQAKPGWLPVRTADAGEANQTITGDVDPVFDKDGTLVVVTERYNSGQAKYLTNAYVKPPGGEFARQPLSDESSLQPDVAVDPRGGVAVAWISGDAIKIVRRPPGGSFGAPETVATGLTRVFGVQMEIAPDGREFFAFRQYYTKGADTFDSRLWVVSRAGPGEALGGGQVVTPNDLDTEAGGIGFYELTIGPTGAGALIYEFQPNYPGSTASQLDVVRRGAADPGFGPAQPLVAFGNQPSSPHVALDASGRATAVFCQLVGGFRRAYVADAPADTGAFGAATPLSPGAVNPNHNYAHIAMAPDGSAVIGFGGGGAGAKWATRRGPLPSTFDAPTQVDGGFPNAEPPEVAMGADGVAYAIVRSGASVFASDLDVFRSAGAGAPFLSTRVAAAAAAGDAFEYGVGSDGAGNAVALYKGKLGTDNQKTLIAVPYDGAAPKVTLAGPPSLLTGIAGDFLPTVSDAWGPVTTTVAYDDGGTGTNHAFATPGTHTATATATDAAGFTATASATTTVTDPPPGTTATTGGSATGGKSDRAAPKLRLGLERLQHVLRGLKVTLTSDEAASAKLSIKVAVRCRGAKRARTFSLRSLTVTLVAGKPRTVTLTASKSGKRRLRAAQACGGARSSVTLKVSVVDAAGNVARATKRVSVR